MNWLLPVYILFQFIIGFHLIYPLLLYLANLKRERKLENSFGIVERDYAIIVTAYKQIDMIPNVIDSILKVNYNNYIVYIVADNCDTSNLTFDSSKVIILRPNEVLSSNIKSHFYAISNFVRNHELLTIIDSDNLVHPEYLNELNVYFNLNYSAVQGVRSAKNLNSQYACLDEAGDMYYRFVDRKLLFAAGSSASLAGSGMAFEVSLYKDCLEMLQLNGAGFDKLLQYQIVARGQRVAFAERAIVYDEKTSKTDQLVKQRARWINTWFKFFKLGVCLHCNATYKLNMNMYLFSLMLMRPPLFLLFISYGLCLALNLFFFGTFFAIASTLPILSFVFIFCKALNYFGASDDVYRSLKNYPKFFYFQIVALLKASKANQLSVATEHEQKSSIQEFRKNLIK